MRLHTLWCKVNRKGYITLLYVLITRHLAALVAEIVTKAEHPTGTPTWFTLDQVSQATLSRYVSDNKGIKVVP